MKTILMFASLVLSMTGCGEEQATKKNSPTPEVGPEPDASPLSEAGPDVDSPDGGNAQPEEQTGGFESVPKKTPVKALDLTGITEQADAADFAGVWVSKECLQISTEGVAVQVEFKTDGTFVATYTFTDSFDSLGCKGEKSQVVVTSGQFALGKPETLAGKSMSPLNWTITKRLVTNYDQNIIDHFNTVAYEGISDRKLGVAYETPFSNETTFQMLHLEGDKLGFGAEAVSGYESDAARREWGVDAKAFFQR